MSVEITVTTCHAFSKSRPLHETIIRQIMFEMEDSDSVNDVYPALIEKTKSADVDARIDAVNKLNAEFATTAEVCRLVFILSL